MRLNSRYSATQSHTQQAYCQRWHYISSCSSIFLYKAAGCGGYCSGSLAANKITDPYRINFALFSSVVRAICTIATLSSFKWRPIDSIWHCRCGSAANAVTVEGRGGGKGKGKRRWEEGREARRHQCTAVLLTLPQWVLLNLFVISERFIGRPTCVPSATIMVIRRATSNPSDTCQTESTDFFPFFHIEPWIRLRYYVCSE